MSPTPGPCPKGGDHDWSRPWGDNTAVCRKCLTLHKDDT